MRRFISMIYASIAKHCGLYRLVRVDGTCGYTMININLNSMVNC